jgi:hypothetical protein
MSPHLPHEDRKYFMKYAFARGSAQVRNIIGILVGYRLHWGCAMAFRRELLGQILPFPAHMTESHDQWIALVGNMNRSITYLEADTILHRLHGQNLTPAGMRGLTKILKARLAFIRNIAVAWRRARCGRQPRSL